MALYNAESGDTIQLTSDVTEEVNTPDRSNDYTIDLNGKSWINEFERGAISYQGSGTLRIIDTSTTGTGLISGDKAVISNDSSGTIQLEDVTVTGNTNVITNSGSGKIQLDGVTATGTKNIIENQSSGVIDVNGGTIIANADADPLAVTNRLTGIVNINSDINGIVFNNGTTNITGGFIHSAIANSVVQNNNGTLNISGGVISSPNKKAILNYATINTFKDCILLGKTEGADAPDGWKVYGNATLNSNAEIPEGKNLKIPADATLTIPDGVTLTNKGIINNSAGGTIHGMNNIKNIEDGAMIDPIGPNTVTASLDLENVTTDVKCTDSDVANKITGMTTHNHEDGIPCWKWDYATKTLALHNFDFSLVSESEAEYVTDIGIKLPSDNVTIVFDGNNTIVNKFSHSIIKVDGDITFTGTSSIAKLDVKAKYTGILSFNGFLNVDEGIINVQGSRGLDGKNINVYGGNINVASRYPAFSADNISLYGGTITGKSNGLTDSPFTVEPTLSDNMTHKADTGTWDNTLGEACTYEEVTNVTGISLNKHTTTLYSDADPKTETLQATIQPSNATNKDVTWTSSDPSIASVENGVVTALKPGTTTITATTVDGEKTATCVVTVTQQAVLQHTINATAGIGGTISPSGATKVGTGENKTFTIQAEEGYHIASVKVNGVEQGAIDTYTFTNVKGDHTIFATFEENETPIEYTYKMMSGSNGVWENDSTSNLTFKIDGDYDSFKEVNIDGKVIDKTNYTVEKGSTIVHLKSEYLKTLTVGKHEITFIFADHEAATTFHIKAVETTINKENTKKEEQAKEDVLKNTASLRNNNIIFMNGLVILLMCGYVVIRSNSRKENK